jgi:hypothetical protein
MASQLVWRLQWELLDSYRYSLGYLHHGSVCRGFLAVRKHIWAFLVGMVLFGLDALLLLLFLDVIAILFHGLALFYLFRGFQEGRALVALERANAMQPPAPPQPEAL